jgi:predicted nucleic acid-binding protein
LAPNPDALVDTSIAVPLVVADHDHHRRVVEAVDARVLGLAGHAAFETYSVLTRLPPPARRGPAAVTRLLAHNFPASRFLGGEGAADLLRQLAPVGIAGGAVYDALVGAAAAQHGLELLTRDRRAAETYRLLDVAFTIVD